MSNRLLDTIQMLAFLSPGYGEMLVVAVVALLLYGGNLPQVARSWGKSFAEFRRGISGFQKEWDDVLYRDHDDFRSPRRLEYEDESHLQDEVLLEDTLPEPLGPEPLGPEPLGPEDPSATKSAD